ncbi:hypothetical protein ACGFSG_27995 [Streptomyces sp. NPDC048512]|uniref:hypothetical protein n=1 Tax=Streptomyces sp. NPDC048512 TaxID=3365563 RepID=UPI0037172919
MTTQLRAAVQVPPEAAVGASKGVVRQGVSSAVPSILRAAEAPESADPTPGRPGIRIYAAPIYRSHRDGARWSLRHAETPNAAYSCGCGLVRTARGARAVAALAADYETHKQLCTTAPAPVAEGRHAA